MFDAAVAKSPHRSCDIVIANAGVGRGDGDPLCALDGAPFLLISFKLQR